VSWCAASFTFGVTPVAGFTGASPRSVAPASEAGCTGADAGFGEVGVCGGTIAGFAGACGEVAGWLGRVGEVCVGDDCDGAVEGEDADGCVGMDGCEGDDACANAAGATKRRASIRG